MNDLETSFDRLLGRRPTGEELQTLYRVKAALDLKDNDALWLIIMALQYYQTQYEKIPAEITQATADITAKVSAAAKTDAHASIHAMKAELMSAVETAANQVAHQKAGKVKTQWLVGCVVVAIACLGGTGWYAFEAGWSQGYQQTEAEEAVTQWAHTPEGHMAYELAQAGPGNIKSLAGCEGEGWNREEYKDGYACFPRRKEDGTLNGWRVR